MLHLKNLFAKYASLGASEKKIKEACAQAISEVLEVSIPHTAVKIVKKEITLVVSSAIRYSVIEHKKEILTRIQQLLGGSSVTSIR